MLAKNVMGRREGRGEERGSSHHSHKLYREEEGRIHLAGGGRPMSVCVADPLAIIGCQAKGRRGRERGGMMQNGFGNKGLNLIQFIAQN